MRTSDYPHYQCAFPRFNKAQAAVVPFLDKDVNLVISLQTAVGKTALAECAFGYHLSSVDHAKVVYTSPYKSISSERHRDWSECEQFSSCGVLLGTSDSLCSPGDFDRSGIIIMTSEALDAKSRNVLHQRWLKDVSCFVFDEAHLLGRERRGACLEAAIMRVSQVAPDARMILLSATMTNAMQLSKWIKSLNGKQTKCIKSDWRPVDIEVAYHAFDDGTAARANEGKISGVVELALRRGFGEKVLVFVHSKRTGAVLVHRLAERGVASAFHNASLSHAQREKIERAFNDPGSGLDVLVSTSTLSLGVNIGEDDD